MTHLTHGECRNKGVSHDRAQRLSGNHRPQRTRGEKSFRYGHAAWNCFSKQKKIRIIFGHAARCRSAIVFLKHGNAENHYDSPQIRSSWGRVMTHMFIAVMFASAILLCLAETARFLPLKSHYPFQQ